MPNKSDLYQRMSPLKHKNKIKRLVKNHCASYIGEKHGVRHYCCYHDDSCVFFIQGEEMPSCNYFEQGVLPLDEQLTYDYQLERNGDVQRREVKPRVRCQRCHETFFANSNRQVYCLACREWNTKEQAKLRMRKMREKRG